MEEVSAYMEMVWGNYGVEFNILSYVKSTKYGLSYTELISFTET